MLLSGLLIPDDVLPDASVRIGHLLPASASLVAPSGRGLSMGLIIPTASRASEAVTVEVTVSNEGLLLALTKDPAMVFGLRDDGG